MYTFADLIAELNVDLWPDGEQQNLIIPHRRLFVEALVDLQQWVDCLRINNTSVYPQCNTLFKCGLTVFDAPRGQLLRLYTLDKVNQTTGQEDPTVSTDYCSRVDYRQVDYDSLTRYVSQTLAGTLAVNFWSWCGIPPALGSFVAFPSCWMGKYTFPPPTDAGLQFSPPLPLGFHYPQTSTDAPNGLRAQFGMWAIKGGQIFVAPWIQSTETIILEWNGLKRAWTDLDRVDDDPMLKKAVEAYVRWQHTYKWDKDYEASSAAQAAYQEARANLMAECRQENEIRGGTDGTMESSNAGAGARGASQIVPVFYNTDQSATAQCPPGTTGEAVTATVPAGTVSSEVSVADANSRAASLALQQAGQQLNCVAEPLTYWNVQQTYTATCPSTGETVTITVPTHSFSSTVSQADADAQALASATVAANAALHCTYLNTEQSYTASCISPFTGSDVTITTPAGAYSSEVSQFDADQQASAAAKTQAESELVCSGGPGVFLNEEKTVSCHKVCIVHGFPRPMANAVTVNAGKFSSLVSQADANDQAVAYANQLCASVLQQECNAQGGV